MGFFRSQPIRHRVLSACVALGLALGVLGLIARSGTSSNDPISIASPSPESPSPSEPASPSPAPTASGSAPVAPKPSPSRPSRPKRANKSPASLQRHSGVNGDRIAVAHGDLWVRDFSNNRILRIGSDGSDLGTLGPAEYVPGFQMIEKLQPHSWAGGRLGRTAWLAEDATGVWIFGATDEPLTRTHPAHGCRSISRTGPDGAGDGVLVRFSAASHCPTKMLDFSPFDASRDDWLPGGIAFAANRLWVSTGTAHFTIDPSDGSVVEDQWGGAVTGAGFGSMWTVSQVAGDSTDATNVVRIDPRTRKARFVGDGAFYLDCVLSPSDVLCYTYEPKLFRIDPRTGKTHMVWRGEANGFKEEETGTFTSDDRHVFWARFSTIHVFDRSSAEARRTIEAPEPMTASMVLDGTLWFTGASGALYWINAARI